ncbi:MAG TPA: Trp family transcriptional regulator [Spirochaetia bacterium]|nr:Trp family transcriptional regulator [Spirochaetia bacterium]
MERRHQNRTSPGPEAKALRDDLADNFRELVQVLASIRDPELIDDLLRQLLTRAEIQEISGRWELVKLLESGMSQRRIAERLKMSLCKITRGSRELKKPGSALKLVIDRYGFPTQPSSKE